MYPRGLHASRCNGRRLLILRPSPLMRLTLNSLLSSCLGVLLCACTAPVQKTSSRVSPAPRQPVIHAPAPIIRPPLADRYLTELGSVQTINTEQVRRELAVLNAHKRLDNIQRFRLAALSARDDQGEWERAVKTLEGLPEDADPRVQALVETLKKLLRTRVELRHQTARVLELQGRIQQIKALEKDLQQRIEPQKTP